jgi:RNA polymerase sigma-70 factor (ECF subfamily)
MNSQMARERHSDQASGLRGDRDQDVLEGLRRGEPAAVERLVARYGGRAYGLAFRIAGNRQDAEEVVQDAFWAIVWNVGHFRGEAAFGSWLYRIVANVAYQNLRGRRRCWQDVPLDDALPVFDQHGQHAEPIVDWSPRLQDPARCTDLRLLLDAAMNELPASYRTVVVLRDVEGLSHREISDAIGITVANVKVRLHRARLFLRKSLAGRLAEGAEVNEHTHWAA